MCRQLIQSNNLQQQLKYCSKTLHKTFGLEHILEQILQNTGGLNY